MRPLHPLVLAAALAACAGDPSPGSPDTDGVTDSDTSDSDASDTVVTDTDPVGAADTDDTPAEPASVCGDGHITGAETCDDGGTDPDDGCDASCAVEDGWLALGEPSMGLHTCQDPLGMTVDFFGPLDAVDAGDSVRLSVSTTGGTPDGMEWYRYNGATGACGGALLGTGRAIDLVVHDSPTEVCGVVRQVDLRCAWVAGGLSVAVRQPDRAVGQTAPGWSAHDDHGALFRLDDHRGHYVVLHFGAVWNAPTRFFLDDVPTLLEAGNVDGAPVDVVVPLVEDASYGTVDQAEAASVRSSSSVDARVVLLHDGGAARGAVWSEWAAYGGASFAHTVVVAPDGRVVLSSPGSFLSADLRPILEDDAAAHP